MRKYLTLISLITLAVGINLYFRTFPVHFPQIKEYARGLVEDSLRNSIVQDVYKKFPQYDPLAKEKLIKVRFAEYKKFHKKEIRQQTDDLYRKLITRYQDKTGQTYLMELDCWHWARYVYNTVRFGHPGDEVVNGKQFDKLMIYPIGFRLPWDQFLFYFSALLYKIFFIFNPVPLFTFLFYLPLLFTAVFITVLFLFSYRLSGKLGALITSLFIGLSPVFIPRSCVGWFDMDILNLLMPLSVAWAYLKASATPGLKQRLPWLLLSSFLLGLYCFTWVNWWFIFFIILMYEVLTFAGSLLMNWLHNEIKPEMLKERVTSLAVFLLFSLFWIVLFAGFEPLSVLYSETKKALILNKPLLPSIWPNVFSTVGELRKVSIGEIPKTNADPLSFNISLFCLAVLLFRSAFLRKYTPFKRKAIFMLTLWFLSMCFATLRGIRFSVFLLVPLGISLGCIIGELYSYFRSTKKWSGILAVGAISLYLISGFWSKAYQSAKGTLPLMDDTWYEVLNIIKLRTPPDSVLNSWWDFGDWFKVVAGRRVIFDGQSQDVPQAYWMARAILSSNEEEAVGILRMLNNGGNKAFEAIDKYLNDPQKSVLLLESVLPLDPDRAQKKLLEFLPYPVAAEVMRLLFSLPGNAYFIVDPSMQPKISAISYLGNWNFAKVYIAQNFHNVEKEEILDYLVRLGRNNEEVQKLYQEAFLIAPKDVDSWLSQPMQFYSALVRGQRNGDTVTFANGFIYNIDQQTIYTNGHQIPRSLFVAKDDTFVENVYTNANLIFSALVIEREGYYDLLLLDRELARSMFVRLYYMGGRGLRHFRNFIDALEQDNEHIRVFKILW